MGSLMDLIAGDARDIALALAIEDMAAFTDRDRFAAHLSLGGDLDPTWLDLFAEAVRDATGSREPADFLDARSDLDGVGVATERILERVDPVWLKGVARVPDELLGALAQRWAELIDEGSGPPSRVAEPGIRDLAGRIVAFSRAASGARDVVFAWEF